MARAAGPADPAAAPEARALFARLEAGRGRHLLFGHQDATLYGVGWTASGTDDADVKRTVGDYPAVFGWDFFDPAQTAAARGAGSLHAHALAAHARGGINTFSWHCPNPVTGGNFYDTTPAVAAILPGGEQHAVFRAQLDAIAAFFLDLRGADGARVPVVFRPWHEHNGDWFWWGTPSRTAPEQFAALWRFTVDYLRNDKGVHHALYAWSPNWSTSDDYFIGYPGDAYVDVFGFDVYAPTLEHLVPVLRSVVERAEARGKIPAITEAGYRGGLSLCKRPAPFTADLLAPLRDDPVARRMAWLLVWRNAGPDHHWVPPPGSPFAGDFRAFHRDPYTAFAADAARAAEPGDAAGAE